MTALGRTSIPREIALGDLVNDKSATTAPVAPDQPRTSAQGAIIYVVCKPQPGVLSITGGDLPHTAALTSWLPATTIPDCGVVASCAAAHMIRRRPDTPLARAPEHPSTA